MSQRLLRSDLEATLDAIDILRDPSKRQPPCWRYYSPVREKLLLNAAAHLERDLYCELTGRPK